MIVKSSPLVLVFALASLAVATPAIAQDVSGSEPSADQITVDPAAAADANRDTFTIGVGGAVTPSYEGSDNYVIIPGGAARGKVSGFNFFTRGTQLLVDLVPSAGGPTFDFELGPIVGANLNRVGRIRDARVEALGKRKVAGEVGGFVGIGKTGVITSDYDNLTARVSYVTDVTGVHESYVITPSIEYGTPLSEKIYVGLSASADFVGDGYATTYFNVDAPGAVRSGLPVYNAKGGFKDFTLGALANFSLTGDLRRGLSLVFTGSYSKLQNDFADSPVTAIAGDSDQWFGAVGLAYTF